MPLRFQQPRSNRTSLRSLRGVPTRLVSLVLGLLLVALLMQTIQSPATREKLALMFGDSPPVVDPPPPDSQATTSGYLPTVDRSRLVPVEDNTHFRDEESDAWFHLLQVAGEADPQELAAASVGEVVFAQYLGQPEVYRGRVVTIEGNARRVEAITPAANDLGINRLYRIIVQPDRDIRRPFTLYCLTLPNGWSPDGEIPADGRLRASAMFFKNWVYSHPRGVDISPVFIAQSITPLSTPTPQLYTERTLPVWQIVAIAAAVAVLIVGWISLRSVDPPRPALGPDATEVQAELEALRHAQEEFQ